MTEEEMTEEEMRDEKAVEFVKMAVGHWVACLHHAILREKTKKIHFFISN
jgi:hypothetical protein